MGPRLGLLGAVGALGAHLLVTNTDVTSPTQATMPVAELAEYLSVTPQALYDLRSKGRGRRGFRVGRQPRFRPAEVEAWIAGMEALDGERHRPRTGT